MPARSPVRRYCAALFLGGVALALLAVPGAHYDWIARAPVGFVVLSAGVLLGEMLPIRIPRRGTHEELTLSAAFTLALLMIGGLGPALVAQALASIVQDVHSAKPAWRVRFNVGQYTVSILAAWLVVRGLGVAPQLDVIDPISSGQLPALLVGAVVFFLVNRFVVGTAVALYGGVGIRTYFADNAAFGVYTGVVVLLTAPIVLAAASYSLAVVPLCLAPVVAMYSSISQSARSEHLAHHDPLTGLPNRMAFSAAATEALTPPAIGCVLLLDLDRFKEINDTLGHRFGDLLLVQVAERFRAVVGDRGEIARLGGDEFALVCAGVDSAGALALAREVSDALHHRFRLEQVVVDTQASVGIALYPEHGSTIETLLQKADVAMYRAKAAQGDLELYDERHDHHSPAKLALSAELRSAIDSPEIVLHYQPQLELADGTVTRVEALVRWQHPRLGLLPPDEFVRIAEASDLMKPLTRRVLEIALAQVAEWRGLGMMIDVAVNVSPQALVDHSFADEVLAALRVAGVPPQALTLEVTESALMSDPTTAQTVLAELDATGVAISVDDFGTGYSSLAHLADLPVSEVKIDRSFVSRLATHPRERIIVTSTIDLARHLGQRTVAEGVEDRAQLEMLESLGCELAQGYAIARPLPASEATRWLRARGPAAAPRTLERVA